MRTRISTRYACAEALSVLFPAARRSGPALHRSPYLVPHPQHFHAFSLLTLTWFGILGPFPHHMGSALLLETVLGGMLSLFLNERHECSVDRLTLADYRTVHGTRWRNETRHGGLSCQRAWKNLGPRILWACARDEYSYSTLHMISQTMYLNNKITAFSLCSHPKKDFFHNSI
jgi:hypothetical protein